MDAPSAANLLQEAAALLLSKIRDSCKTTQKAVDCIIAGVNELFDLYLDVLKDNFHHNLQTKDGYITEADIVSVLQTCKGQSIFEGVNTKSKLEIYMRKVSGGEEVALQQIVLETKIVLRRGVPRSIPSKFGYIVPFIAQLEQLLNCADVLQCVDYPLPSQDCIFRSVTDGLFFKYHQVVQKRGPNTLAILMHVDDAETCDPLKSKANKHNLRLFYWVLGNIHPDKRSSLKAINLLAIVKTRVAKEFGNDPFLEDFVSAMKKLGTDGVELKINGVPRRFYAVILFGSCDNPAAANLGGFKESHFALRPCRMCMVKSSALCDCFVESYSLLRKIEEHEKQVKQVLNYKKRGKETSDNNRPEEAQDMLVDDPAELDECDVINEKYVDHKNPSVNFGINGRSILSDLPGFDVTKCLPQDFMHLLPEGTVELVCRLVLKDMCFPTQTAGCPRVKPSFTLASLNKMIECNCYFGLNEVSKPSKIDKSHILGRKMKQSASQMLVLLRLLPFIILGRLPQEKVGVVLKLIRVVDMCLSYELTETNIEQLETLIEDFGNHFKAVFPKVKTLKLHCLVHLKTQARLFGPIRQQSCFRFEAMHYQFTSLVPVVRTKKNIAFSAASRHLSARNSEILQGKANGEYLSESDCIRSPEAVQIGTLEGKDCLLDKLSSLTESSFIFKVKEVSHKGSKWYEGVNLFFEEESFGRITEVFMVDEEVVFLYNNLETKFIPDLNAHEILYCRQELRSIKFSELKHKFPVLRNSFSFKSRMKAYLILQNFHD